MTAISLEYVGASPAFSRSSLGKFWKRPVAVAGWGRFMETGFPPGVAVSVHTIFFIPSFGATQGPPLSLHPGEPAIVISKPSESANRAVNRKASFHSGVM